MSLKKFEQWLIAHNLDQKKFIFPLDRIASKLGYSGLPLVYHSYFKIFLLLALYWVIFFPISIYLLFAVILQDLNWFPKLPATELGLLILVLIGSGVFFGGTVSFFIKKTAKTQELPPWQSFCD